MSRRASSRNGQRKSVAQSTGGRTTQTQQEFTAGSLVWWAPFLNNSGYGEEARGLLAALARRRVHVAARSSGDDSSSFVEMLKESPDLAILLSEALNREVGGAPVTSVIHAPGYAMRRMPEVDFTVGRTMFETDRLPPDWVAQLNLLDEVWVPSSFNVETFRSAGVTTPIEVVPGGVDGSLYRPALKPLPLPSTRGSVFLSIFEWSHRKAPDVLLRAWAEAFSPDDEVSLVLRCSTRQAFDVDSGPSVAALVDAELAAIGRTRSDVAPVVILGRQLPASAMPRLLAAADVFVGVSRGEGWGRPLMEAMACAKTTIGTRWGGNVDFMDETNSLLVDVDGLLPVDDRMDVPFYRGHRWAEPSADHLVELLRTAHRDQELRKRLGRKARIDVERKWQWQQIAAIVENRTRSLIDRAGLPGWGPTATDGTPRIRWKGDIFADHSLATINRELVQRLAAEPGLGVEVSTSEPTTNAEYLPALRHLNGIGRPVGRGPVAVEVRHSWPPDFTPSRARRLVLIQPWEFGGVPANWIEPMTTRVDETWVYTNWVRDCYLRSGIPADRVAVVPIGVDTVTFCPDGPKLALEEWAATRFLFVGGTISRKGFDLLLDTYLTTFGPHDDVSLVVKPFGSDSVYRSAAMDSRIRSAMDDPRNPRIELVDRRLSRAEMAALYRACDVLVHPYRGEGFGLPVAEAMACGLPSIVTGYGACLDFCDETTSWLIPAQQVLINLPDTPPGPAGFWWAEPDQAALAQMMHRVASASDDRRSRGELARKRIVEAFTWEEAAATASRRLAALVQG